MTQTRWMAAGAVAELVDEQIKPLNHSTPLFLPNWSDGGKLRPLGHHCGG